MDARLSLGVGGLMSGSFGRGQQGAIRFAGRFIAWLIGAEQHF
ncbi:hypothetical protein PCI56_10940 [Plesiomonas shigelloides subsp. oncorhynchi]|nr:hypothetical protein [Plesiomonas shigelloides]